MDWGKFGYLPYKTILRFRKDGLSSLSHRNIVLLSVWFLVLSVFLLMQTPSLFIDMNIHSILLLSATVFFWFGAPQILPRIGKYPEKALKRSQRIFNTRGTYDVFS